MAEESLLQDFLSAEEGHWIHDTHPHCNHKIKSDPMFGELFPTSLLSANDSVSDSSSFNRSLLYSGLAKEHDQIFRLS